MRRASHILSAREALIISSNEDSKYLLRRYKAFLNHPYTFSEIESLIEMKI